MRSTPVINNQNASSGQYNGLVQDAKAAASFLAHSQLGTLALGTNATNGQTVTLTINGSAVVFTAVSAIGSTAGNFLIAGSAALTIQNLLTLLNNPGLTNANVVALSPANQKLVQYLDFAVVTTSMVISHFNTAAQQNLTSFSASTTVTSGTYTANTMALYIEPGLFYVSTSQTNFLGGSTSTFSAPAANPRIDVVTVDTGGSIGVTVGSENASPTAPTYPTNVLFICEVYHRVGETKILDYDDGVNGYISKDARSSVQISYVIVPTGMVAPYAGSSAPSGWLLCDGSAVSRATYATLFGIISTSYGIGDGTTTFNLPDFRGRSPIGVGTGTGGGSSGTGTPSGGTALTAVSLGTWKGEETHTLTTPEIPSHTHDLHVANGGGGSTYVQQNATATLDHGQTTYPTGGDGAHNNLQPVMGVNFIIKI